MWIPHAIEDLKDAIARRATENVFLDVKRECTTDTAEIAKDVAAMANYGGVLVYGVDEERGTSVLADLTPIDLSGVAERIQNTVVDRLYPAARIDVHTIPTADDPGKGYVVVAIPLSPHAPHMVHIRGENQYVGRVESRTVKLDGPHVELLFARRQAWALDRHTELAQAQNWRRDPRQRARTLTVMALPVGSDEQLLDRALRGQVPRSALPDLFNKVLEREDLNQKQDARDRIALQTGAPAWQLLATGYLAAAERWPFEDVEIEVGFDGRCALRTLNALRYEDDRLFLHEQDTVQWTCRVLGFADLLFVDAGWQGPVMVGVSVGEIRNAVSWAVEWAKGRGVDVSPTPMLDDDYRRTDEVSAATLHNDRVAVAQSLLAPLFAAAVQGEFPAELDPFG